MRSKGESALFRVPKDKTQPLRYYQAVIELPPDSNGGRRRKFIRNKDKGILLNELAEQKRVLKERGDLPSAYLTVAQWFTMYYETTVLKNVRPKTAGGYKSVIFNHIIPAIGKVKLDKVTSDHIRRVTDGMIAKGLSTTYAKNAHRIIAAGFAEAVKRKKVYYNPAAEMDAPRARVVKLDALTLDEALHLLEHVSNDTAMGARWATALLTGARRGEVLGIEVDRVTNVLDLSWQVQRLSMGQRGTRGAPGEPVVPADFEYRHLIDGLYLTHPKSKAGTRIIPLFEPLKSILERHIAQMPDNPYGLLFVDKNGRPIDPDQDSRMWRTVLAETGIKKNVRLHDLRHTAVDMLLLAGVPSDLIPDVVGHSTRAMSMEYKSRGNRERLSAAMDKYGALFMPQIDA